MRIFILLAGTSLLAACGGGGDSGVISAPPLQTGGGGGSDEPVHSFANPKEVKTYSGVGGSQVYDYQTDSRECCNQQAELYAGNASTVRDSKISITYDPRDGIYSLDVADSLSGASSTVRFQDPASRTDFDGNLQPQWGTPQLSNPNVEYLQAGEGDPRSAYRESGTGLVNPGDNDTMPSGTPPSSYSATSFFFLKPGTETQHVSWAGYVRNSISWAEEVFDAELVNIESYTFERGAFAYGVATVNDKVPTSGSGSYSGSMLGTMIFNPTIDGQDKSGSTVLSSYFQWIEGTANLSVDFSNSLFNLSLDGTVFAPQIDNFTSPTTTVLAEGSSFVADGSGSINLVNFGGFKGAFDTARFANPNGGLTYDVNIAGSSIDGAFYGPNGEEAGGGFRIVGGNPDERIDILGAFVGKK